MSPLSITLALGIVLTSVAVAAGEAARERVQIYSPIGKRDPFKPPTTATGGRDLLALNPLERFTVEQFQLRAILKGIGKSRAMIEDPEGRSYIVGEGDRIGRERATISKILSNEIIVTEKTFNYLGNLNLYEKILSLPPDKEILQSSAERAGAETGTAPEPKETAPARDNDLKKQ